MSEWWQLNEGVEVQLEYTFILLVLHLNQHCREFTRLIVLKVTYCNPIGEGGIFSQHKYRALSLKMDTIKEKNTRSTLTAEKKKNWMRKMGNYYNWNDVPQLMSL